MPAGEHLYFHIPFCAKLCPYCSFYVDTSFRNKNRGFLEALLKEVSQAPQPLRPKTIYFGGGTPSALSIKELEFLLGQLHERLDLSALQEWNFEVNPATVSAEKAKTLRQLGVNRISIGVQSWEPGVLKTLGRIHDADQCERTFALLRKAGFDNINIDLMFAVPGQTLEHWRHTLSKTIALAPEHISAYCLTYEEDTDFFRKLTGGQFQQNNDWDADLFELAIDMLGASSFEHYEISNYARPGHRSLHNSACWAGLDYLGFGPGAFSTSTTGNETQRWQNVANTAEYIQRLATGRSPVSFEEKLSPDQRAREVLAFQIRTENGVPESATGPWSVQIAEFLQLGILERDGGFLRLTRKGKLLADTVAEVFV